MKSIILDILFLTVAMFIWDYAKKRKEEGFNLRSFLKEEVISDVAASVVVVVGICVLERVFSDKILENMDFIIFGILAVIAGIYVWFKGEKKEKIDYISTMIAVGAAIFIFYAICC